MVHDLGRVEGPTAQSPTARHPTLVLLHGFTDSGLCWPDAVRRWRQDYRIIAPDARGHGESARFDPATSGSNRSDDLVADVVSLLETLTHDGDDLPLLIGHSMGAATAGTVLAERPDLVLGAVLEDPPWFTLSAAIDGTPGVTPDEASGPTSGATSDKTSDKTQDAGTTQQWAQGFRDDLGGATARGRAEFFRWPEVEFGPWGLSKAQLDPSLTASDQIVRHGSWIVDVAGSLTRPTLLVTGDRENEVLVGSHSRQQLVELGNDHIEVVIVPGAGHTVRRDCADAYHQIVDNWMAEQFDVRQQMSSLL